MKELEDIKLKALLQELQLEKPGKDFSSQIMQRIQNETTVVEKRKKEKLLGRGFWIVIMLFLVLLIATLLLSQTMGSPELNENSLLSMLNNPVSEEMKTMLSRLTALPLSIAGILMASSLLLFLDRYLTANKRLSFTA